MDVGCRIRLFERWADFIDELFRDADRPTGFSDDIGDDLTLRCGLDDCLRLWWRRLAHLRWSTRNLSRSRGRCSRDLGRRRCRGT